MSRFLATAMTVVFCLSASTLSAQLAQKDVNGRIKFFQPPSIVGIETATGEIMLADVSKEDFRVDDRVQMRGIPPTKVKITGEGAPKDLLKKGMLVRFNAFIVNNKIVRDPVKDVTVTTAGPETKVGLFPNRIGGEPADPKTGEEMLVTGTLSNFRGTMMTVEYGERSPLRARLAPDAFVKLDAADIRLASIGDEVSASGRLVKQNKIFATDMTINKGTIGKGVKPRVAAAQPNQVNPKKPAPNGAFLNGAVNPGASDPDVPQKKKKGKLVRIN